MRRLADAPETGELQFAVDAHAIGCRQTGNEVYIRNLLEQFAGLDDPRHFVTYVANPGAAPHIPAAFRQVTVSSNPFRRLGLDLSRQVRKDRPKLLHVQYTGPLRSSVPLVTTVHDVSFLECPRFFTRSRALQLRVTVGRTVERAAKIITVSEFSRRAILRHYSIAPEKVVTIPNAVADAFCPTERASALARIRKKYRIPGPVVLTVGDLQPRKNHLGLIRAFEELVRAHPRIQHHLVIVGKNTWYTPALQRAVSRSSIRERVHFPGFVDDSDLRDFYGACDLFVFPSYYEGFGLPILEAMACGRAVACSNTTAMPEVADGAGLLFDPESPGQMTRVMADVLGDSGLRSTLERKGVRRAKLFRWERAARLTLDVYHEVAGSPQRFSQGSFEDADRVLLTSAAR